MISLETTLTTKFPCGCKAHLTIRGDGTESEHRRQITRCINHKPDELFAEVATALEQLTAMVRQTTGETDECEELAERTVACVNACRHLSTEKLQALQENNQGLFYFPNRWQDYDRLRACYYACEGVSTEELWSRVEKHSSFQGMLDPFFERPT